DPDSTAIRAYHVLNEEAIGQNRGMARPGFFVIDTRGIIREKFFEAKYRERLSGNGLIAKLFPELGQEVTETVDAPHLQLKIQQPTRPAARAEVGSLAGELHLPADVHVYAPGVKDYKPINLVVEPKPGLHASPPIYPRPRILYLPAIKERVPVFAGTFRITQ